MTNTKVTSKYRIEFWILEFIMFMVILFAIWVCFYFSRVYGPLDYQNPLLWLAGLGITFLPIQLYNFLSSDLRCLTVTDEGIEIKHFTIRKSIFVSFKNIEKYTTTRIRHYGNVGWAGGYEQSIIDLTDRQKIIFDEYQFVNYSELKIRIYKGIEKQNKSITSGH